MLQNSYECSWCGKDLRGKELPQRTSELYYENASHLSTALELWNIGYQHEECDCKWSYDGKIIKDGLEEFKDKYKIEEIIPLPTKENSNENNNNSAITEDVTTKNIENNKESEETSNNENL